VRRALNAVEKGHFDAEVAAATVQDRKGERVVEKDETPFSCDIAKIPSLKPAFNKDGTVTAASSSSISDGAAALIVVSGAAARSQNLKPLARIVAHASFAQAPEWFTTAPVGAMQAVLAKTGWNANQVDLYEVNEAFACVAMAAINDLKLDAARVNVNGGACALGHPIGASGARIVVTLLAALEKYDLKRGVASLCIGGGEATAMAIERV
jgi:acetyl-CoA C-acetyltransferase